MENLEELSGLLRGFGIARIRYIAESTKKKKKNDSEKFLLQVLSEGEFSRKSIFKTLKIGIHPVEQKELFWIILFLLRAEEQGASCLPLAKLKKELLDRGIEFKTNHIKNLNYLILEDNYLYLNKNWTLENSISKMIKFLLSKQKKQKVKVKFSNEISDEQKLAVEKVFENSLTIISGGPGTGKTRIIKEILRLGLENYFLPTQFALLTPTGKAAKRLKESTEDLLIKYPEIEHPLTIHRFLGYNFATGKFKYNLDNHISKTFIIVDESSMIDLFLMNSLLEALPFENENLHIIFLGDSNQLLSVNTGSVFTDLCNLDKNHFRLSKTFRQSETEGKSIKELSQLIQNKQSRAWKELFKYIKFQDEFSFSGCNFIPLQDSKQILIATSKWYMNVSKLNQSFQILCPFKEAEIGTYRINSYLKTETNSKLSYPSMINSNLSEINLFNGETGILEERNGQYIFLKEGKEILIPPNYLSFLEPAFAITVHKSQGSEYDHIALILPANQEDSNLFLNQRILYTAITRAKKSVTIFGSEELFEKAVFEEGFLRYSNLVSKISN